MPNTARCNLNGYSQFTIYASTNDVLTAGGDILFHANASGVQGRDCQRLVILHHTTVI